MRHLLPSCLIYLVLLSAAGALPRDGDLGKQENNCNEEPVNTLTKNEKTAGWKLLFDGKSIEGWRHYKSATAKIAGWWIEEGTLHKPGGVRAGDIMTIDVKNSGLPYEDWYAHPDLVDMNKVDQIRTNHSLEWSEILWKEEI